MNPVAVLLFGNFLSCLGTFLSLPLFGLHLAEDFKLQPATIGLYASIWPATVFFTSSVCGIVADRWGYYNSIAFGICLTAFGFALMGVADKVFGFAIGMFFFGLGKSFFDSSIRAALCCLVPPDGREQIFRYRYMVLNLSCILGPIIGVGAYRLYREGSFYFSSLLYCVFLALFLLALFRKQLSPLPPTDANSTVPIGFIARFAMLKDRNLAAVILSSTLILACYGIYESLMPVVIANAKNSRPEFGFMLSLNGFIVVLFQLIHVKFLKRMTFTQSQNLGFFMLILGFAMFAVPDHLYVMTVVGVVVFSVGESLLFPGIDALIDRLAPESSKAAFFGASELKQAGFFIGPLVGGVILQYGHFSALFIFCCVMSFASLIILKSSFSH